MPRCKPFKYTYEKEIVMYAFYKKLDYFSTECVYAPNAYRGFAREFLKDVEVWLMMMEGVADVLFLTTVTTEYSKRTGAATRVERRRRER